MLVEKLRSLGISTRDEPREVFASSKTKSRDRDSKGKKENSYVEAVNTRGVLRVIRLGKAAWLQLGEDRSRGRELGKDFGFGSRPVCFGKLGKK